MTSTAPSRHADTDAPLAPLLGQRWSPRAFDSSAVIDIEVLRTLLEAARWSPSASNVQPWRFIVAPRGSEAFTLAHDMLLDANRAWADSAAALIVNIAQTLDADGAPQRWAHYDVGQAVAHLSIQAQHEGLHTHQMGGFDIDRLRDAFDLAADLDPVSITAIGVLGDATGLPEEWMQQAEAAPRARKPLDEIVLNAA